MINYLNILLFVGGVLIGYLLVKIVNFYQAKKALNKFKEAIQEDTFAKSGEAETSPNTQDDKTD